MVYALPYTPEMSDLLKMPQWTAPGPLHNHCEVFR